MDELAVKQQQLQAAKRLLAVRRARESLLEYLKLRMPDPNDPLGTLYVTTPAARLLCDVMEKIDRGELKRVAISIGPQFGKSDITSRAGPAWLIGRNPHRSIMLGAYNQDFANDFGEDVRNILKSPFHAQVFPEQQGLLSASVGHIMTAEGGQANFVGVGGSGTGKPADVFIVDDPIRNDDDAQSETYRERLWKWFNGVVFSRCHDGSAIIVVHTRWHQDDLIGRLCDPDHPERKGRYSGIAQRWTYINLPAVIQDPNLAEALGLTLEEQTDPTIVSMFGAKPMTSLWPESIATSMGRSKSLTMLAEAKQQDSRIFGALYMGEPTPEDGDYFKNDMLVEYGPGELPDRLTIYGASDHAVSTKQMADKTVLGVAGVDEKDDLWILPDLVWSRMETDRTVEELIRLMRAYNPFTWWMESELISKSFGPFLYKRMREESVFTYIDPVVVSKDKMTRARAIQGRMSHKRVHFPRHAQWWPDAKSQLLKFPFGTNDDFVDFIAHLGAGLNRMLKAPKIANDNRQQHGSGTIEWILSRSRLKATAEKRAEASRGW